MEGTGPSFDALFLKWTTEQGNLLAISCMRSGNLSRLGDETLSFPPSPLFMGRTQENLFEELMNAFNPEWLKFVGRYEFPNLSESKQSLSLQLTGEGIDTGIEFIFDGQNSSPPEDFIEFVELAILLTNPWYEEQLATKTQRKSGKGNSPRKN